MLKSKCFFNTFCSPSDNCEVTIVRITVTGVMWFEIFVISIGDKITGTAHITEIVHITQGNAKFQLEVVKIKV